MSPPAGPGAKRSWLSGVSCLRSSPDGRLIDNGARGPQAVAGGAGITIRRAGCRTHPTAGRWLVSLQPPLTRTRPLGAARKRWLGFPKAESARFSLSFAVPCDPEYPSLLVNPDPCSPPTRGNGYSVSNNPAGRVYASITAWFGGRDPSPVLVPLSPNICIHSLPMGR